MYADLLCGYALSAYLLSARQVVWSVRARSSGVGVHTKCTPAGIWYGVATISRLLKIVGLFCRIWSLLQGSFAKETYNFKEPTDRSHPICTYQITPYVHTKCIKCSGVSVHAK